MSYERRWKAHVRYIWFQAFNRLKIGKKSFYWTIFTYT